MNWRCWGGDSVREVLQSECPHDMVLRHVDGEDLREPLWRTVKDLGWTALSAGEEYGGLGLGPDALALLYRELGTALAPVPLLPTLIASELLYRFGNAEQRSEWLGGIAAGERRVALMQMGATPLRLVRSGSSVKLYGTAEHVLELKGADLALVLARSDEGETARVMIHLQEDGVVAFEQPLVDVTRSFGKLRLDALQLPAGRVLGGPQLEHAIACHGTLAIAADSTGGADTILALTVEYLKTREQFGRLIGSFQALKHRCADHKMALVAAEAILDDAVSSTAADQEAWPDLSAAKVAASEAYAALAQDAVQLHGGIGFTWEHVCHLFLKRAKLNQSLFGSTGWHLDQIGRQLAA
ncbi:acyl-CoA dehydrogenase family protein [Novosphingobium colocasiae]